MSRESTCPQPLAGATPTRTRPDWMVRPALLYQALGSNLENAVFMEWLSTELNSFVSLS